MKFDTNALQDALFVYLGGLRTGAGINPVGPRERLRAQFPADFDAVKEACDTILEELMADDQSWRIPDGHEMVASVRSRMQRLHPEFDNILCAQLASWYAYQWR